MDAAYQANGQLLTKPFEVYALLAVAYFCLCATLTGGVHWIQSRIVVKNK